jgi:membrane protein YqaA with SNARE-associated domain
MLRKTYNAIIGLAARPSAPTWLAGIAFAEASCFPIPPDLLLLPMGLAQPRKAWRFAAITTIASVLGGGIGYFIGDVLFNQIAQPIIQFYHYQKAFAAFQTDFARWGAGVILMQALLPIPFPVITLASGAAKFNFLTFFGLSFISRGFRFFLESTIMRVFGEPARHFIEKRLGLVTAAVAVLILGAVILLKLA